MAGLRDYVISVTAGAILCGIVLSFSVSPTVKGLLKLICGIFLAFTLVKPVTDIAVGNFKDLGIVDTTEAEAAAEMGESLAAEALENSIKQAAEAYILDKAQDLELELEAEVSVTSTKVPVPYAVTIRGQVPPYMRELLSNIIEKELGIEKESQTWTS